MKLTLITATAIAIGIASLTSAPASSPLAPETSIRPEPRPLAPFVSPRPQPNPFK